MDTEFIQRTGAHYLGSMPIDNFGTRKTLYLPDDTNPEHTRKLLDVLERACTPLPRIELGKGLTQLMVLTKRRAETEDDTTLSLALFAEKLGDYPADAVAYALNTWPEHNTFFPSWHELKKLVLTHCWSRVRVRDNLRAVLQSRSGKKESPND